MTTADHYRLSAPADPARHDDGTPSVDVVRFLLWLLLVISAVANTVSSYAGSGLGVHLACGAVTGLTATALVVRRLKGKGNNR